MTWLTDTPRLRTLRGLPPDSPSETAPATGIDEAAGKETSATLSIQKTTAVGKDEWDDQCERASPEEFDVVDTKAATPAKKLLDDAKAPRATLTLFGGDKATAGKRVPLTWSKARDFVSQARTYASKGACPMFRSGLSPDDSRASGHEPITEWTAVIVEHDAEAVTLDAAATKLREAGVAALLFTSASHMIVGEKSGGGPRWRAILLLAKPVVDATEYRRLVRCANGILKGAVAPESSDVNRCWYYGRVKGVPYESAVVEGLCIDELDDLAGVAELPLAGRPARAGITGAPRVQGEERAFERVVALGQVTAQTMADLRSALHVIASDDRKTWADQVGMAMASLKGTEYEDAARETWIEWSRRSDAFKDGDEGQWDTFKPTDITYLSIFALADEVDASWRDRAGTGLIADTITDVTDAATEPSTERELLSPHPAKENAATAFPAPFRGVMANAVDAGLKVAHKAQPEMTTLAALAGMAAGCPGQYRLPGDGRLNLYAVGIADTGAGKDLPRRVGVEIARAAGARLLGKPASGQGLEDALVSDHAMLVEVDEVAHMLAAMNERGAAPYLKELAGNLLKLFSAGNSLYACRARAKTKENFSAPRVVGHPCTNLLGFTTPSSLGQAVTSANVEDGLLGRILFAKGREGVTPRLVHEHLELPADVAAAAEGIRNALGQLAFGNGQTFDIQVDMEAHRSAVALMKAFSRDGDVPQRSAFARAILQRSFEKLMRVAAVLAVWDAPQAPAITREHLEWAELAVRASNATVLEFVEEHMHEGRVQANAARVLGMVRRAISGEVSADRGGEADALGRGCAPYGLILRRSKLSAGELREAVQHLQAAGEIEVGVDRRDGAKGGRRDVQWLRPVGGQ